MKDKNGKTVEVHDFVKFTPPGCKHAVIGRIAHLDKHNVIKHDEEGDPIPKKKGGVETEEKIGQILYFRANTTEFAYFNPAECEVVLKHDGTSPK